ncbi:MAG: hypothetical protein GY941_13715 [Planctomycetes bacterium]|nr:hypothetical protein [Planctomycetota bacterium]
MKSCSENRKPIRNGYSKTSMQSCPSCSKPLKFKAFTSIVYGFIPSCNKNSFECESCGKIVVPLNWFLIVVYFHFGTVFFWGTILLGFRQLPLALNIINLVLGLGSYAIIMKGFALRNRHKKSMEIKP